MYTRLFLLFAFSVLTVVPANARTIEIPDDYDSIQEGIENANNGDRVLVAEGEYNEKIDFLGKNIHVASHYILDQDTAHVSRTILYGNGGNYVVLLHDSLDRDARLEGFSVRNTQESGYGIYCQNSSPTIINNYLSENGTAIYGVNSNPEIRSNTMLENNIAIELLESTAKIWDNKINNNVDGIILRGSTSRISIRGNNISDNERGVCAFEADIICCLSIINNETGVIICGSNSTIWGCSFPYDEDIRGEAIKLTNSNSTIFSNNINNARIGINCVENSSPYIDRNVISDSEDVGIYIGSDSHPIISHNQILRGSDGIFCTDNSSAEMINNFISATDNDAIGIDAESEVTLINNTITNVNGAAINLHDVSSEVTVINSLFWNNESHFNLVSDGQAILSHCCIDGNYPEFAIDSGGTILCDPRLTDDNSFYIQRDSPCIDAGDNEAVDWDRDIVGYMRIYGIVRFNLSIVDIGALEYGSRQSVNSETITHPDEFVIIENFPNPFNSSTIINYSLPIPTDISLVVYNQLGRKVTTLFEGSSQAGIHSVNMSADELPSGLYFIRLEAGDKVDVRKVVLMR